MDAPRLFKSFLTRPAAAGSAPLLPTRDFCGLAPIVDDIGVRPIVTGVIVPLHGYALEVGAKAARDQSLPGHFSAGIGAGYDALKVF
jgi:hypothetical protein